jgi:hypothetical protein
MTELSVQHTRSRKPFRINFGPQHPSAHGVLRLIISLVGETVLSVCRSLYAALLPRTTSAGLPSSYSLVLLTASRNGSNFSFGRFTGSAPAKGYDNILPRPSTAALCLTLVARPVSVDTVILNNLGLALTVGLAALCLLLYKNGRRYAQYGRELQEGWRKSSDRMCWLTEVVGGMYLYVFNPINAVQAVIVFLLRNILGHTAFFAWFYFINLLVYWLGGMAIMAYVGPGRFRSLFLYLFPVWLFILFLFYEWGYFPLYLRVPLIFGRVEGVATVFRICSPVVLIPLLIIVTGGDPGSVDLSDPGPSVFRGFGGLAVHAGGIFVTYKTFLWMQNSVLRPEAPPGSAGAAFHKKTTWYTTPEGAKAEAYVAEFVQKHGLGDTFDGRFRGWVDFYSSQGLKPSVLYSLAKQRAARSIPLMTAVVVATVAGSIADDAEAATKAKAQEE